MASTIQQVRENLLLLKAGISWGGLPAYDSEERALYLQAIQEREDALNIHIEPMKVHVDAKLARALANR